MEKMLTSWSASLEHGEYAEDRDLVIRHAVEAVDETSEGIYVNIVTPHEFGNPDEYLTAILHNTFPNRLMIDYIDQCGCGGHVLRVYR